MKRSRPALTKHTRVLVALAALTLVAASCVSNPLIGNDERPEFFHLADNLTWTQDQRVFSEYLPPAHGWDRPLTYSLSPAPPAGITFNPANHTLSGTPTTTQPATTYTYTVTDADGDTDTLTFTITINRQDSDPTAAPTEAPSLTAAPTESPTPAAAPTESPTPAAAPTVVMPEPGSFSKFNGAGAEVWAEMDKRDEVVACMQGMVLPEDTFCLSDGFEFSDDYEEVLSASFLVAHLSGGEGVVLRGGFTSRTGGDIELGWISLVKSGNDRVIAHLDENG